MELSPSGRENAGGGMRCVIRARRRRRRGAFCSRTTRKDLESRAGVIRLVRDKQEARPAYQLRKKRRRGGKIISKVARLEGDSPASASTGGR